MDYNKLAGLILPEVTKTPEHFEKLYPKRNLPEKAVVSRFAPSPTGFVHMGSLRTAFIAKKIADDTNGVFYIRIEDTDEKRSVENGIDGIITDFNNFDFNIDEGRISETEDKGEYGPYLQTERQEIYKTYVKKLIAENLAYPCFCSEEELSMIRKNQEARKARLGYYGRYAKCRHLTLEEIEDKINSEEKYVIRIKSPGSFENKIVCDDLSKGKIEFPENDIDIVLLKSDGIPTYHLAHAVDDHLMRTTHILRGDEWLSSFPIHKQLFNLLNFELPKYCHLAPVNKKDGDSIRKLSKRKDPEAAVSYYHEKGIPTEAVKLYLMTTANSNFEGWLDQNKDKTIDDFAFDFKKMSVSGSIFDIEKLVNISKNYLANLTAENVYNKLSTWASKYDVEFYELINKYKDYTINVLNIEREQKKPRKDFSAWSEVKDSIFYMYDELYNYKDVNFSILENKDDYKEILKLYIEKYFNITDDKQTWFDKIKKLTSEVGYCPDMKEYKENPSIYKGNVADISNILRLAITTKTTTPDLYEIMKLLGKENIQKRINDLIK